MSLRWCGVALRNKSCILICQRSIVNATIEFESIPAFHAVLSLADTSKHVNMFKTQHKGQHCILIACVLCAGFISYTVCITIIMVVVHSMTITFPMCMHVGCTTHKCKAGSKVNLLVSEPCVHISLVLFNEHAV